LTVRKVGKKGVVLASRVVVVQQNGEENHLGQHRDRADPHAARKDHFEGPGFGDARRDHVVVGDGNDRKVVEDHDDHERQHGQVEKARQVADGHVVVGEPKVRGLEKKDGQREKHEELKGDGNAVHQVVFDALENFARNQWRRS